MPNYERGGKVIKTGKIGRVNCLRQQLLLPGEVIRSRVRGTIRLTPLRERETSAINARIDCFIQPLRWLWRTFPDYIKHGPYSSSAAVTTAGVQPGTHDSRAHRYGIGGDENQTVSNFWRDSLLRIYNEWYKWPEDTDLGSWGSFNNPYGPPAIALPTYWTRMQQYDDFDNADYNVSLNTVSNANYVDIRSIAETQARFSQAVERTYLSHGRYIALLREMWNSQGNREVDKVPIRVGMADLSVEPRDVFAVDGSSLGQAQSMYDFDVAHSFGNIVAPEHSILSYLVLLRFESLAEDEINPFSRVDTSNWAEVVGDSGILANTRPQAESLQRLVNSTEHNTSSSTIGYLPAGWRWRASWNNVGHDIDIRDSFPLYQSLVGSGITAKTLRQADRVRNAFKSTALGDYYCDLRFSEMSDSPIPSAESGLFAGQRSARGSAYPYPGPRRVI